jgi:hypothetical protein
LSASRAEVFDDRRDRAAATQPLEQRLFHVTPPQVPREEYTRARAV